MDACDIQKILDNSRKRLIEFVEIVPENLLDFEAKVSEPRVEYSQCNVRGIIHHVIDGENGFIQKAVGIESLPECEISIEGKSKAEILEVMAKVRARTTAWISANEAKLDSPMKDPKEPLWMMFFWTAEHDIRHVGQLILLMTIAGFDVGWL